MKQSTVQVPKPVFPQLHSECVPVKELDITETKSSVELPALEPVGIEIDRLPQIRSHAWSGTTESPED
jgi:hypothetical protein